jgi:SNF2 family DNA or RNA helicase
MTGTPISETPVNAYTVLKLLSFDPMPHISRFENYYCTKKTVTFKKKERSVKKVVGFKNLDELKTRIEKVSIRRTKDEMRGFPDRIEVIRDVTISGKQLSLYRAICGEVTGALPASTMVNLWGFLQNSNAVLRLRQLMNHPNLLNEEGDSAKYREIDTILEELFTDPEAKVVIWTAFRSSAENLYERYRKSYGAVKVIGGLGGTDLERAAYEFENAERPRVAVCTAEKAGTGTDFLARARTAIYIDRPYSYVLYKQSMERIHRRTKTTGTLSRLDHIRAQPATLIFLDAVNSVDALVRDRLFGKRDLADAMTTDNKKLVEIGRADLLKYFEI